jgi:hypothetical protein
LRVKGVEWSAQRIPTAVNLGFLDWRNEGVAVTKTNVFLFTNSHHVSAQEGHRKVILEEEHKWCFILAQQLICIPSTFVYFLKNHLMMAYLGRNMLQLINKKHMCDGNPFILYLFVP